MAPESFITYHRDEEALTIIGHLMDSHNKHSHTLNDISFKLQELEETVTVSTNLSAGTGIEITNDNIINLDFSEFSTDNITEGSTNFFHSDERVDDRISNLLQEGSNIVHTYDDIANTFTISTSMDPTFDTVDSPIVFTAVADVNIIRGQVVYISGTAGNGSTPTVDLALASNTTKMPAFGMARDNVNAGETIKIVTFGSLYGITLPGTLTFALGDTLYVSSVSAGAYTNVPPGGESNLIQNIGKVQRIGSNSSSVIKVGGAGRTNATSNLNSGNIFYGNSSDRAVTATLTEGNNVTITHDSVSKTLTISALGTAVSGNENEVHVINSTGDGFKASNPLLYADSATNALIVGYDSTNPTQSGSDLISRMSYINSLTHSGIPANTSGYYYLGHFNLTSRQSSKIFIYSNGNAAGAGSEFIVTRHYSRAPHISGLLGENYLYYRFFYVAVDHMQFALYIQPVLVYAVTLYIKIQSYDYSFNTAPTSGHSECLYGLIQQNEASVTYVGTGTANPTSSSHSAVSDDRLKFNETTLTNSLNVIRNLMPVKYDQSGTLNEEINTFKNCGFIAQEVYEIDDLKDAILVGNEETPWQINYNYIYAHNLAATKELDTIVQNQQTAIKELNTLVQTQQTLIEALETRIEILENTAS